MQQLVRRSEDRIHLCSSLASAPFPWTCSSGSLNNSSTEANSSTTTKVTTETPQTISISILWFIPSRFYSATLSLLHVGGIYKEILPRAEYFSQALYTFDIGQNDITSSYFVNNTTEEVEAIIPDLMERLTSIIQVLFGRASIKLLLLFGRCYHTQRSMDGLLI